MTSAITLFTGQWADIPLRELLPQIKAMGYDGVELACWGDHFNVQKALSDDNYLPNLWQMLQKHDLQCHAISAHLVGQAICDNIDQRHQAILPEYVWGNGIGAEVQKRAEQEMVDTIKAARLFMNSCPYENRTKQAAVVNGFTGSSIWHAVYAFPPTTQEFIQQGFVDFADRFASILATCEQQNVNFALEVHPTEIAFDIASAERAIEAVNNHPRFQFNYDPSHLAYQGVDYIKFLYTFANRIAHCHMKDVWWQKGDGSVGVFGGHTNFCDSRRFWDFRSIGRGNIDFQAIMVALHDIAYQGPLSVEWEDGRMNRFFGAEESCRYVRNLTFARNNDGMFDANFDK